MTKNDEIGRFLALVGVVACVCVFPCALFAQNSAAGSGEIEGVARDSTGALLTGVVIEASSPALIEGSRTTKTDVHGRYRISGLRPGIYTVTFTLEGFATRRIDAIEVQGESAVHVPADMETGPVKEEVTVTVEPLVVDVRRTASQIVFSQDLLDKMPLPRFPNTLPALVPGIDCATRDVGQIGFEFGRLCVAHGGRAKDQRIISDGLTLGVLPQPQFSPILPNTEAAREIVIEMEGSGAESQAGGVRITQVPHDGGHTLGGSFFATAAFGPMQSRNLTQTLVDQGMGAVDTLEKTLDFNPALGGPIVPSRLWFFVSVRRLVAQTNTDQHYNLNEFQPENFVYAPDWSRQGRSTNSDWMDYYGRITWQANPRIRIAGMFSDQENCDCVAGISPTRTPEAGFNDRSPLQRTIQVESRVTLLSRLMLEFVGHKRDIEQGFMPPTEASGVSLDTYRRLIGVTVNNGEGVLQNNFIYHGPGPTPPQDLYSGGPFSLARRHSYSYNTWMNYLTGAHTLTIGAQDTLGSVAVARYTTTLDSLNRHLRYTFANPYTPQSFTVYAGTLESPVSQRNDLNHDMGVYIQDTWTMNRLTLKLGGRFDWYKSSYPEQTIPPTPYGRPATTFAPGTSLSWKDFSPRFGLAHDLMGDHKTVLKFSLNRYVVSQGLFDILGNPLANGRGIINNFPRNWIDLDGDYVVDCDIYREDANGECTNRIAPSVFNTVPTVQTDAAARYGWGLRPYNWQLSLGVQHELWPRATLDVSYHRRWFGNFLATDDTACVDPVAGTGCRERRNTKSYDIHAPVDSRLPGGGGYAVEGFVDYDCGSASANCGAASAAQIAALAPVNQVVRVEDIGAKQIERWDGFDVSLRTNRNGLFLLGGASTGRRYTNECEVWSLLFEVQGLGRPKTACEVAEPFRTSLKGVAAYTLPRVDALPDWLAAVVQNVQLAGIVQSIPGNEMAANYNMTNTEFARPCPSTLPDTSCSTRGQFLANMTQGANTRNVNLLLPATRYDERHHQVDLRLGKRIQLGRTRMAVNLDVFNVFNANPVLARNNTLGQDTKPGAYATAQQQQADGGYNSLWVPTSVLPPRLAKFSLTFDF